MDSFNLYIKGTMLLSRVKTFNLRFRARRFMGDPAYIDSPTYSEVWEKDSDKARVNADPRRTPGFIEIDHIASMFRQSFPLHLRNPIRDGCVDSHLYSASLIPHVYVNCFSSPLQFFYSCSFIAPSSSCTILTLISTVLVVCLRTKYWKHLEISWS